MVWRCVGAHGRWFNVKRLCQRVAFIVKDLNFATVRFSVSVPVCDFKDVSRQNNFNDFDLITRNNFVGNPGCKCRVISNISNVTNSKHNVDTSATICQYKYYNHRVRNHLSLLKHPRIRPPLFCLPFG